MKRRMEIAGWVTLGAALASAFAWRAMQAPSAPPVSAPCFYYAGTCAPPIAMPVGRIQLIP
ncbi:hypothetical protein [Paraburkholderia unamae]|uniref:Uncharacterized protein n=1 Tax=Paraburkholderia unamae TaxID=219649 RepID=A0ABX5KDV7_9BURK|nr:hypothetical protein [Paraburkholderia unamae]PVX75637.1 hypothetical protein C7402_11749 [Paraburkholderia unamae]RAR57840.1 hypothetical protein C7401_11459 [Paraburkholderia unamae]